MQDGMFTDLEWETLVQKHKAHWDILQRRYSLSNEQLSFPSSLDDLARQCIALCRRFLFSTSRALALGYGKERDPDGWKCWDQSATINEILRAQNLEQMLAPALCDHLIVTFAHQFYCENLVPKIVQDGLKEIFNCQAFYRQDTIEDAIRENISKHDDFAIFSQKVNRNFTKHCIDIQEILSEYRTLCHEYSKEENVAELFDAQIDQTRLDLEKRITALKLLSENQSLSGHWKQTYIAAPDWMFTLTMAEMKKSVHIFRENDWVFKIYDGLSKASLFSLLTKLQNGSEAILHIPYIPCREREKEIKEMQKGTVSALELREVNSSSVRERFVAIACSEDATYAHPLPRQEYRLKTGEDFIKISEELQYTFNNYLLEKNFHGYAICTLLNCIQSYRSGRAMGGKQETYYLDLFRQLPQVMRLRAPLVHAPLILAMSQVIPHMTLNSEGIQTGMCWLNEYIDYWNATALPIVEELFLWGIKTYYPSLREIHEAIERSIVSDENGACRGDRMNLYRRIPKGKSHIEKYNRTLKEKVDSVASAVRLSMMGFKLSPERKILSLDPGCCTAFN